MVRSCRTVASSDAVDVAVHDLGGAGPVVLFAHATGFHGMVWAPLARHLTDTFRCVAFDFRGHGDSPPPDHGSFDWSGFADDVLAVATELAGSSPLYGVGHSMGAASLLLAEERAPGTFHALFCWEPIVMRMDDRESAAAAMVEHPLATGARRRREVFASRDAAIENFASKPPFEALDPDALTAYVEHGFLTRADGTVELKCRPAHEAEIYANSSRHDAFDHLDRVRCPVVVAAGAPADDGAGRLAEPVAAALANATFERHEHLGHFGPLEDPRFVACRISAHLAR